MRIIYLFLKIFQTVSAETPRLKYFALLPLALCFVIVDLKNFLKRRFLSYTEHNRISEIITFFQIARRQGNNNLFLAVLL